MKKITILLLSFLLIGLQATWAQGREITGKVTSSVDGQALPGVSVIVKGTKVGITTNVDGEFTLQIPEGATTLEFRFIGLATKEVEIGSQTSFEVTMEEDVVGIEEVVVTAMGIKKEAKALGYAVQGVEGEEVTIAAQPNITNSLQGKVAGVLVQQSSGMPGSSSLVTIRGAKTLDGNNTPMLVVDGLPVESGSVFVEGVAQDRVTSTDASSRMNDINPEDIESIEILKGPAASAIYGLRASNGVIVITTKNGSNLKKGEGIVTFSTSYTLDKVTRLPKLQSTYAQGNGGVFSSGTSMSWGPKISELGEYVNNIGDTVSGTLYDNVTPFFQNGGTYTADLGVQRATENMNYAASIGFTNQSGIIPTTGMKRYTGRINGDVKISDKISSNTSIAYTRMEVDKIANGSNLSNPLFTTYFAPRSYDLWGTPYAREDDPYAQYHYRAAMDNPRWSLENNNFTEINDHLAGITGLSYNPWKILSINYKLGVDYVSIGSKEVYELGSGETGGRSNPPSGGKITDFLYQQREVNSNLNMILKKSFGSIGTSLILGNEIVNEYSRSLKVIGTDFNIGGYHNLANTTTRVPTEYTEKRRTVGFYGNLQLDFKQIFYLTSTVRNDIVSYLAEGNRSYIYPSIDGSFIFTELFKIPKNVLPYGKIRASWAQVGQDIPYTYGTQNVFITGGAGSGYLTDGIEVPLGGVNSFTQGDTKLSNDLKPALSSTIEFGAELRFFNNRFGIDYTYYEMLAEDQILQVPVPTSTGYFYQLTNAGSLETKGHELTLNLVPLVLKDFKWSIDVNFTKYNSKVLKLAEGVETIYLGGFETPSVRAIANQSYPSIYGIGYLRDDKGNIVVLDDPSNTHHGMPIADEQAKKIGDVQPDFVMGFVNTFTFKGLSLTAFIDWKKGGQMYSGNNRLGRLYGMLDITEDREDPVILDAVKGYYNDEGELVVTGKNDIAVTKDGAYWNEVLGEIDEAHVMETSYVRFRELSLGYTVPSKWLDKTFVKGVNISFVARNIGLWSSYPNFDPETSTTGATNGQGIEYVALPQTKSFGGKLSFTF